MDSRRVAPFAGGARGRAQTCCVRRHWFPDCSLRSVAAPRPVAALTLYAAGRDKASYRRALAGCVAAQTGIHVACVALDAFGGCNRPRRPRPENRKGLGVGGQTPFAGGVTHSLTVVAGSTDHGAHEVWPVSKGLGGLVNPGQLTAASRM